MNKVHKSLSKLLVDIDTLVPLAGNPRVGNVDAISASLDEFGQLKPIVIRDNGDGTATVIAGNHTMEAARRLGWDKIAAVNIAEMDEKQAITFALADNRINEMGSTDAMLLHEAITSVIDEYPELFISLGWDEFEMAAMDEHYDHIIAVDSRESGYIAPVLKSREDRDSITPSSSSAKTQPSHIVAPESVNINDAITRGSSSVGQAGAKAVVQYTLVFDNSEQQRRWYDFIRWVKADPGTDGETTAQRLLNFLDAHANY